MSYGTELFDSEAPSKRPGKGAVTNIPRKLLRNFINSGKQQSKVSAKIFIHFPHKPWVNIKNTHKKINEDPGSF